MQSAESASKWVLRQTTPSTSLQAVEDERLLYLINKTAVATMKSLRVLRDLRIHSEVFALHKDIVQDVLLIAVWNRRPETSVIVHSDQWSQNNVNRSLEEYSIHN